MTKSLSVRLEDMIAILGDREEFVADGFENGSLRVLLYAPRGGDPQQPTDRTKSMSSSAVATRCGSRMNGGSLPKGTCCS